MPVSGIFAKSGGSKALESGRNKYLKASFTILYQTHGKMQASEAGAKQDEPREKCVMPMLHNRYSQKMSAWQGVYPQKVLSMGRLLWYDGNCTERQGVHQPAGEKEKRGCRLIGIKERIMEKAAGMTGEELTVLYEFACSLQKPPPCPKPPDPAPPK